MVNSFFLEAEGEDMFVTDWNVDGSIAVYIDGVRISQTNGRYRLFGTRCVIKDLGDKNEVELNRFEEGWR